MTRTTRSRRPVDDEMSPPIRLVVDEVVPIGADAGVAAAVAVVVAAAGAG